MKHQIENLVVELGSYTVHDLLRLSSNAMFSVVEARVEELVGMPENTEVSNCAYRAIPIDSHNGNTQFMVLAVNVEIRDIRY